MSVKGIDVSSNNGQHIDFRKLRNSGARFVYIKVTEGNNYVNPYAADHARQAKAAGLLVGAYAFVSPKSGRTGRQEADYFIEHARKAGLLRQGCLRPCADIEITALPAGKQSRLYHMHFVTHVAKSLGARSFNAFDGKPLIYTGGWFWDGVLRARFSHGCPLWLAAYTPRWKQLIPKAFRFASFHQYTDKLAIPGLAGAVDGDVYLGRDLAALKHRHTLKKSI